MSIARRSQKDASAFIFQFRSSKDALAHCLFAQTRVERVGVLLLDEGPKPLRHRRLTRLPLLFVSTKKVSDIVAKRIQFSQWLGRKRFVNDSGAHQVAGTLVSIEKEKENVIVKTEE